MTEGGEQQGGLNLGFKIQGKTRTKVAVNVKEQREDRQLITGVAGSVIQAAEPSAGERQQHVIPRLENTYKAGVGKFVPTFVPESSSAPITGKADDRYEKAAKPDVPGLTSYGLQLRQPKGSAAAAADGAVGEDGGAAGGEGAAGAASGPLVPVRRGDEAQQLKDDLEVLPDEASVEDYEAMPVEAFGKALLRGLGWADGQGVGRKRQLVEAKQTIRRPDRLGLGANPAAPPPDKRPRKMGDKPRQDLVAAPAADGGVRHRVGLDEALVPRASLAPGPAVGKAMALVAGRHAGLACVVRRLRPPAQGSSGPGRVLVELQPSHEVVEVAADELGEKGERGRAAAAAAANGGRPEKQQRDGAREGSRGQDREQDRRRERSKEKEQDRGKGRDMDRERGGSRRDDEQRHRSSRDSRDRSRSRSRDRDGERQRSSRGGDGDGGSRQRQQQQQRRVLAPSQLWLAQQIRVRVVDKRLQGGRLYLKKGTVLDVAPDGSCDLRMEGSRQVISAHQEQLETVVPKDVGAAVMVVAGQHRGRRGRLLQVSLGSGAAALQLVGDMSVVRLVLDDVAQFMGHLEEEED
ncbi:DExH-box splicing factor binding site-domain-containing protein [Scenedesmus sp. NREL 46B-D3]|nr:DExH-box splicing factor binding site-domain-containing protein [Scenedesmus sp. NREL 46B-D3]